MSDLGNKKPKELGNANWINLKAWPLKDKIYLLNKAHESRKITLCLYPEHLISDNSFLHYTFFKDTVADVPCVLTGIA